MITWALLLWPLLVNSAPFYSEDSASYLRGGAFGFDTAMAMFDTWWRSLTAASPPPSITTMSATAVHAVAESGGTRSLVYSLTSFLLRAPGDRLLLLAIAQAGAVAVALTLFRSLIAPRSTFWHSSVVAGGLAALTSAAWYAAYVVPDILAGVAIASATILTAYFDQLSLPRRLGLVLLAAFSITVHGSHLPIVFATLAAGTAGHFWLRRPQIADGIRRALWFFSPIVIAVGVLLGSSFMAFGEFSLAPKRYPIQLARAVADGPGAWHLRDHCATERYAICEIFGPNPPRDVGEFLWAEGGVRHRATAEQMNRIRAEESLIVRRAVMEYPGHQLRRSVMNTLRQVAHFGTSSLVFGREMTGGEDPAIVEAAPDRPTLKFWGELLIYVGFVGAIMLLLVLRRKLKHIEITALAIAGVGLLANAAVCGILSGVTDRYQGRVAWVLPAIGFTILLRLWSERRSVSTSLPASSA